MSTQVSTPNDIKKLGTILSVWAHPDDETILAGGIMAAAIKNLQQVICVTATRGEAAQSDPKKWPPETLGDVRTKELQSALKELGVVKHHWLGYKDGKCERVRMLEAINRLLAYINLHKPDTILTFGPEGFTGHPDHQAVSRWVTATMEYAPYRPAIYHAVVNQELYDKHLKAAEKKLNVFYNIDEPPFGDPAKTEIMFELPPELLAKKRKALEAMPSQTAALFKYLTPGVAMKFVSIEMFKKGR